MRRFSGKSICVALLLSNLSCSVNILKTFADTNTNEALYEDALKLVNEGDYDEALDKIALMTGTYPTDTKVLELKASAYGGKCGLNFLDFAQALQNIGSTKLFELLLAEFTGRTLTHINSCIAAENTIESIGAVADRSLDQNVFLIMIEFAKIGNILSYYVDSAPADGTPDPAYDACAVGGAPAAGGPMTDAHVGEIGTGITIAYQNLQAVSSEVSLGGAQFTEIDSLLDCSGAGAATCAKTNPASFTALELKGIRSVVVSTDIGLSLSSGAVGTCPGDITQCACP